MNIAQPLIVERRTDSALRGDRECACIFSDVAIGDV